VKACGHGPVETLAHAVALVWVLARRSEAHYAPARRVHSGTLGWPGGLTNGAVARRLYISPHTVNTHLRHVFAKLGVSNRVALATMAHHLIE
jgi:hypothetical protein